MEGSPPERDVLLATKLQVPRSRPGLVPRRRLADRLEEGLNRGLVLVAAPAGYGKSVLLSEWVRGMTEPVAWLSLDGEDNDPVRLEVLAMLAAGRSNQGIASHLVISLDTVKKHVSHVLGKLGAANRTEAVSRARQLGLIA